MSTLRNRWQGHAWSVLGVASYVYLILTVEPFTWLGWLVLVAATAQVIHLVDRIRSMRRIDHTVRRVARNVTIVDGAK